MKFSRQNGAFYSGLKETVYAYFRNHKQAPTGNSSVYGKGLLLLAVYITACCMVYMPGTTTTALIAAYVTMGLSGVMLVFNIVHDASHQALFRSPRMNAWAARIGDLVGINTRIWNIRHNIQHHSFTNVLGGDLIIENIPLIRLSPHQAWRKWHRYQIFYAPVLYLFYSFYWILVIDFKLFFKKEICNLKDIRHPAGEWAALFFFKSLYLGYTLLLPWLLTPLEFGQVCLLFLLMHMAAGALLSIVAVLGHFVEGPAFPETVNGKIENNWSEHELEATIDFSPGSKVIHWITGGLNTHVAHHLFPRICHVHYYRITPLIQEYCKRFHYPYKKESLAGALRSHFRYLDRLSRPPQVSCWEQLAGEAR